MKRNGNFNNFYFGSRVLNNKYVLTIPLVCSPSNYPLRAARALTHCTTFLAERRNAFNAFTRRRFEMHGSGEQARSRNMRQTVRIWIRPKSSRFGSMCEPWGLTQANCGQTPSHSRRARRIRRNGAQRQQSPRPRRPKLSRRTATFRIPIRRPFCSAVSPGWMS